MILRLLVYTSSRRIDTQLFIHVSSEDSVVSVPSVIPGMILERHLVDLLSSYNYSLVHETGVKGSLSEIYTASISLQLYCPINPQTYKHPT